MRYVDHITKEGDRWDLLAYRYYGNAMQYESIIASNPAAPIRPILDAGLKLRIPVIDDADTALTLELPPWKR